MQLGPSPCAVPCPCSVGHAVLLLANERQIGGRVASTVACAAQMCHKEQEGFHGLQPSPLLWAAQHKPDCGLLSWKPLPKEGCCLLREVNLVLVGRELPTWHGGEEALCSAASQHLTSFGERKSQPALQEDTLQENKKAYTMNTYKHYSHSSGTRVTYCFRNTPHPRMLCHIPGLDNSPICSVRDSCFEELLYADRTAICKQKADRECVLNGNARGNSPANNCLPRPEAFIQRGPGSSQCAAQHGEGLADVPERTQNSPNLPEKLLKKRPQTSAQPASTQGVLQSLSQPSSARPTSSHGPQVQQDADFDLSFLHGEIKVLEKLKHVLQTDSLTEIQEWLSKASLKEMDKDHLLSSRMRNRGSAHADTPSAEKSHGRQWKQRDVPSHAALQQGKQQTAPLQGRPKTS
ncbi:uncharacterized protein C4orf17 homolog isoform X2 [Coturnix japonica]|uniref:uncharacterized protein C4orf17 homolog isoform X2 n=1 Tax=Coturnix japonica TaxID=93934 RepID=UPI0013A5E4E4|nr:uncharacterized protein C4orf17 homolog isoform X2 [Coturnix japonica]